MNRLFGLLVLTGILGLGTATLVSAAEPPPEASQPAASMPAPQLLKGELVRIDGEFHAVKGAADQEVRLRVTKETVLDATIKTGDKIDADMLPDARIILMFRALQ